jgi:hypothetical protein
MPRCSSPHPSSAWALPRSPAPLPSARHVPAGSTSLSCSAAWAHQQNACCMAGNRVPAGGRAAADGHDPRPAWLAVALHPGGCRHCRLWRRPVGEPLCPMQPPLSSASSCSDRCYAIIHGSLRSMARGSAGVLWLFLGRSAWRRRLPGPGSCGRPSGSGCRRARTEPQRSLLPMLGLAPPPTPGVSPAFVRPAFMQAAVLGALDRSPSIQFAIVLKAPAGLFQLKGDIQIVLQSSTSNTGQSRRCRCMSR